MGAVEGSALSVAGCVTGRVSVLCVCGCACVCACVCVWDTCAALLLVEPANRKAAAASLSLGRDPGSPGTGLGSSVWAGGTGPELLEAVAVYNIP